MLRQIVAILVGSPLFFACFRQPPPNTDGDSAPVKLIVADASGTIWSRSAAPRAPVLTLMGNATDAFRSADVWLLHGPTPDVVIEDLLSPPLRAATRSLTQDISVSAADQSLRIQSKGSLAPGDYTLVWARDAGPAIFPLRVSESPDAGAALVDTFPPLSTGSVPPNLPRFLLRFDGHVVADWSNALDLRLETGPSLATSTQVTDCSQLHLSGASCVWVSIDNELRPSSRYTLTLRQLSDATGAPLPNQSLSYQATNQPDRIPPGLVRLPCAADEIIAGALCALPGDDGVMLRGQTDEPAFVTFGAPPRAVSTLDHGGGFLLWVPLDGAALPVLGQLTDGAGNRSEERLTLSPARGLATLTIDEVLADPEGPESEHEFVELLNFGEKSVHTAGFSLAKDPFDAAGTPLPPVNIAPGERLLLVGPDFRGEAVMNGPPIRLLRLGRNLSLSNAGAALYLRDERGARISAAPALPARVPGECIARRSTRWRAGGFEDFSYDPQGGCSPGAPTPQTHDDPSPP